MPRRGARRGRLRRAWPWGRRRQGRPLVAPRRPRSTGTSASRSADRSGAIRSRLGSTVTPAARTRPSQIADNYLRFVEVYAAAVSPSRLATRCGFLPEQLDVGDHAGDDRQPEGEQAIGEHARRSPVRRRRRTRSVRRSSRHRPRQSRRARARCWPTSRRNRPSRRSTPPALHQRHGATQRARRCRMPTIRARPAFPACAPASSIGRP